MLLRSLLGAVALAAAGAPLQAAEVTVKMLNSSPNGAMVFEPAFVRIAPGDSVKFVATDKGHNVESIKGMAPEGSAPIKGVVSKDETVTFEKEGVYGLQCAPHYMMGMIALDVVGTTPSLLEKVPDEHRDTVAAIGEVMSALQAAA